MIIKKSVEKSPYQWSLANSYLQNHQGRKHFWGVGGKDYGLVQSSEDKRKSFQKVQHPLDRLSNQHIGYLSRVKQKKQKQYQPDQQHFQHPQQTDRVPEVRQRLLQKFTRRYNDLAEEGRPSMIHNRTQPSEESITRRFTVDLNQKETKSTKRVNLSLLSNNVSIKNEPRHLNSNDSAIQIARDPQFYRHSDFSKRERVQTQPQPEERREISLYRDRIVKVVKRDRMNNPTFCNSRNYPLSCYRYLP